MTQINKDIDDTTENRFLADKLRLMADLLEQQAASVFRVRAYRDAADYISNLPHPIRQIYERGGRRGLDDLPTIGTSIAGAVAEMLDTGRWTAIDRLRGTASPEKLFQTVPMIGPALAHAIHADLGIDTLEALEAAAHDGRLATINGIGQRRVESIGNSLADMLRRRRPRKAAPADSLPVADILDVDQVYRSTANNLPTIKPRRFNPDGDLRIPILHTERGDCRFTALFSNTATAHRLGRTRDWVVIYVEPDNQPETQVTVVTEHGGALDGRRVIRGLEPACAAHYAEVEKNQAAVRGVPTKQRPLKIRT